MDSSNPLFKEKNWTNSDTQLFSLRVADNPGVLFRIVAMLSRKGSSIQGLLISPAGDTRFRKITLAVTAETEGLRQIRDQMAKLVDVIEVESLDAVNNKSIFSLFMEQAVQAGQPMGIAS